MVTLDLLAPPGDAVDEAKTYLRIEQDDEDALTGSLIASAIRQCEIFCAQILLARTFTAQMEVSSCWKRLAVTPVRSITRVDGIPAEGAVFTLPANAYSIDIDSNGDGWVRVIAPGLAAQIDVIGQAGIATSWGGIPEPLRQGAIRLVSHHLTYRDVSADNGWPAAVAALWQPFRRMRLS
jgi:uncharacterized phiE125 gp8 family phage protein